VRDFNLLPFAIGARMTFDGTLQVSRRSVTQRAQYATLLRSAHWLKLAEASMADVRHAGGDALEIIAAARELRAARRVTRMAVSELRLVLDVRGRSEAALDAGQRSAVRKAHKTLSAAVHRSFGSSVVAAARDLVRMESAALQSLAEADVTQTVVPPGIGPGGGNQLRGTLHRFQRGLHGRQRRIYLATVRRTGLVAALNDLSTWVIRNMRGIVATQAALSALRDVDADAAKLVVASGFLIREAIASHLAARVGLFTLEGIPLHRDAAELFSRGATTAFTGRLEIGKRATVARLRRLPDGMLVRVEGTVTKAGFDEKDRFMGTLQDDEGDSVAFAAPVNFLHHGLRTGARIRISGFWRKAAKRIEPDKLNIRELYGRDMWKIAFLDLAAPHFHVRPADFHIAYQLVTRSASTQSASTEEACLLEKDAYETALAVVARRQIEYTGAIAVMAAALYLVQRSCPGPRCARAVLAFAAAASAVAQFLKLLRDAEERLTDAAEALHECLVDTDSGDLGSIDGDDDGSDDDGVSLESFDSLDSVDSIDSTSGGDSDDGSSSGGSGGGSGDDEGDDSV